MRAAIIGAALLVGMPAAAQAHHARHHHRHYAHHHRKQHPMVESLGHGLAHMLESIGNTQGMNHDFVEKLRTALGAIDDGACHVGSGFRSHAEQARLHRQKPGLAAPPGHSNHERGLAADLSCRGRGLSWLHAHAREYGLRFPMAYEPWHIEPIGATRVASRRKHYAHHHHTHYARAG